MRHKLRYRNRKDAGERNKTSAESRCPLVCLSHDTLLSRARFLATALQIEKKKNSYWYENYIKARKQINCKMPENISKNFTADHLEKLIDESTKVGELNDKSVLFYILHDTLNSLKHKPCGVRYSQPVIKWCVSLANKVHKQGYESIQEALPLPCWTTLQSYRLNTKTADPISEENLTEFRNLVVIS